MLYRIISAYGGCVHIRFILSSFIYDKLFAFPRNIILRYSKKKDWILDQFLGSGTTLIEAKLLGRNAIGVDINSEAIKLSNKNLNFTCQERTIL